MLEQTSLDLGTLLGTDTIEDDHVLVDRLLEDRFVLGVGIDLRFWYVLGDDRTQQNHGGVTQFAGVSVEDRLQRFVDVRWRWLELVRLISRLRLRQVVRHWPHGDNSPTIYVEFAVEA
ncbi:hypothetical protein D3C78_1192940 [compost metagenome]